MCTTAVHDSGTLPHTPEQTGLRHRLNPPQCELSSVSSRNTPNPLPTRFSLDAYMACTLNASTYMHDVLC